MSSYYRTGPSKSLIVLSVILGVLLSGVVGYFGISYYLQTRYTAFSVDDPSVIVNDVIPLAEVTKLSDSTAALDSDGDGYSDKLELAIGTDPQVADVYTEDNSLVYVYAIESATLAVVGTPDIFRGSLSEVTLTGSRDFSLALSQVIEVYVPDYEDTVYSAVLRIKYPGSDDRDDVSDSLAIFKYTGNGVEYLEDCRVSSSDVFAHIYGNGRYFIADKKMLRTDEYKETAIAICIDDSGSMYEDLSDPTCGKDIEGHRWDFVTSLVEDEFFNNKDTSIAIYSFTGQVKNLMPLTQMGTTASIGSVMDAIMSARNQHDNFGYFTGTSIYNAIQAGIDCLNSSAAATKYLMILTDGQPTDGLGLSSQLQLMSSTKVIPIVIGLGDDIDYSELKALADVNAGLYMPAANAKALKALAERTIQHIDGELLSIQEFTDYIATDKTQTKVQVLADSGFRCDQDGLPFTNMPYYYNNKILSGTSEGISIATALLYSNELLPDDMIYPNTVIDSFEDIPNADFSSMHLWQDVYNSYWGLGNKNDLYTLNTAVAGNEMKLKSFESPLQKFVHIYSDSVADSPTYYFDQNNNGLQDFGEVTVKQYERALFNANKISSVVTKHKLGSFSKSEKAELELIYLAFWWQQYVTNNADMLNYEPITDNSGEPYQIVSGNYAANSALSTMYDRLTQGKLCLLQLQSADTKHIVAVSRLLRSYDNPNLIYLECYDANMPSTPLVVTLEFEHITDSSETTTVSLKQMAFNQSAYKYDTAIVLTLPSIDTILEPAA